MADPKHTESVMKEAIEMARKWSLDQLRMTILVGYEKLGKGDCDGMDGETAEMLTVLESILKEREMMEV